MENRPFNLSFHGSRTLNDERVRIIVLEEIERHRPTTVVTHAEPEGVCEVVRTICREKAIPLKVHFLNFKYLRGAFERRSKDVLNDCDYCVFIHDGRSKGTLNERRLAEKMEHPHSYYQLDVTIFKSSVGFEIDTEWELESTQLQLVDVEKMQE
jgi:hypothetical protein